MSDAGRVRFGMFEFDPATRELRREGVPVRLQSQPAQVLAKLIAHAGETVTRETLREALWGTETFVDFDRGLNFCIAQIRAALGDSAEAPRFVKTFPKRGYQFIAPVGPVAPPEEKPAAIPPASRRRLVVPALLALLIGGVILFGFRPPSYFAPSPIRIAVTRFDNETGSADLDRFADGLTDSVVAELTASGAGRYAVIGNAAILREPRNKRDLVAIGSALKTGYVVIGQVQRNSSGVRVLAHLIRVPDQTHLWVTRVESGAKNPLPSESELAQRITRDFTRRLSAGK
jgi:DNA-binding winged helix-turn-helix (wHTH) protein/TolB-like protein